MRRISLFVEDSGHEEFLKALIIRLRQRYDLDVYLESVSVRHGHGSVISELKQYIQDLQKGRKHLPDVLLVATDSNCQRLLQRTQEIEKAVPDEYKPFIIHAIPDPHIERWMLIDSAAFKSVFGKGCKSPDQKCNRDRYKRLLIEAIQQANPAISPLIGGFEYAADIVNAMNIDVVRDKSLQNVIRDLSTRFKQWSQT